MKSVESLVKKPNSPVRQQTAPVPLSALARDCQGHNGQASAPLSMLSLEERRQRGVVSIGDRIEMIRACLEARMGTTRFQALYRSLASDHAAACLRESRSLSAEELMASFAGTEQESDISGLAPLVAKLVACENSYFS